ncbi:glycosyltransferase family 2 protein [Candidatus Enterococcus clewellii]|uniref:Glycosyl hydrolase n=1 Tax=Candidatus Enterococcus clewellii TaxID=1834193 RepID=A0A242JY24_9ENTE|nr:glycosyltransferase family A protein [Enterococcus sp. 9E7_DIV0242]OTP09831.1 glycosyl hydrolase [Enterococcus sp. 9E7_DIV0242]
MRKDISVKEEFKDYQYLLDDVSWKEELSDFELYTSKIVVSEPKVSVIIANYNNGPYLKKMMDSLVNQTLDINNIQVMFIDDCSTDNSIEVIKNYIAFYPNLEIYQLKENTGGAHGPRNVGIMNARGEYSVFLDSDDWYDLNGLKYLSDLLDESGDDFVVSGLVQSVDGYLSLKSKPYYSDGDFKNRSIQELPTEFYGWLGPQAIMVRTSLVHDNNLHFVNQRVADDVTFFYEALRLSKTITQGKELTTYLNRDADNDSLSKSINRTFMISWLRALGYINQEFPDDSSKERMISRRLEWLIYDFCIRRGTGYKFSKSRLLDFKEQMDLYLGKLNFDPSIHFRSDVRQVIWKFLKQNDIDGLYFFIQCQAIRWVLVNKLGIKKKIGNSYFYPSLLNRLPKIRLNAYAIAESFSDNQLIVKVYTHQKVIGFEARNLKEPFSKRKRVPYKQISDTDYQVTIPTDYIDKENRFTVVFDNYLEVGIQNFKRIYKENTEVAINKTNVNDGQQRN